MEERTDITDTAGQILKTFDVQKRDIRSFSPLALAFVGDNVFDLVIRTIVAEKSTGNVSTLHKIKSTMVRAGAQSRMADEIMSLLTEDETAVYKRGRNAKSHTVPKNADVTDYRKATGVEALFGYLYLEGRMDRVYELLKKGCRELERYLQ